MLSTIDQLANTIVALPAQEQEMLLERVAELNFQRGLEALAAKYRARLAHEARLNQTAAQVMTELKRIREEIAAHDYQA